MVPFGVNPLRARCLNATAIDAVRLSMSTAPRPPHLAVDELAAEGVPAPPVGVDGHHVGVAHEEQPGADGSLPSIRARTLVRPGWGS
jgi:hypothetical protein